MKPRMKKKQLNFGLLLVILHDWKAEKFHVMADPHRKTTKVFVIAGKQLRNTSL
jgi:hypothetical protein